METYPLVRGAMLLDEGPQCFQQLNSLLHPVLPVLEMDPVYLEFDPFMPPATDSFHLAGGCSD